MNHKLHTAVGLKDILSSECLYRHEVERRISNVFEKYAYLPVSSPTLEFVEVLGEKTHADKAFKMIDRDGSVLALRTDMTPPIARIVSTNYSEKNTPYRLYYLENSFRYNENLQGKSREFKQAGVELVGINSVEADCEIIRLAISSLINTGLKDFKITLGHVDFINGILEEISFDSEILTQVQDLIIKKDFVSIKDYTDDEILNNLQFLMGGIDTLNEIQNTLSNRKSSLAILQLVEIYGKLKQLGLEDYISFDLSMIGNFEYYTGIIFSAYTYGIGFSIIDGGRYDNLLGYFGLNLPAVGFAIKINDLCDALKYQNIIFDIASAETLFVCEESAWANALKIADELRSQGVIIENSLLGSDLEKNIEYAKNKNINGIIYFKSEDRVKIMNLSENTEAEIGLGELLNGGIDI